MYLFNQSQKNGVYFVSKKETYSIYDDSFKFVRNLTGRTVLSQLAKDVITGKIRYSNVYQTGSIFSYRNGLPPKDYDWTVFKVTPSGVSCADACINANIFLENTCVMDKWVSCTVRFLDKFYLPVVFEYLLPEDYGFDWSIEITTQGAREKLYCVDRDISLRFTNFILDDEVYSGDMLIEFSATDMHYEPLKLANLSWHDDCLIVNDKKKHLLTGVAVYKCLLFNDVDMLL